MLIPIANGSELIEIVTTVDVLRRAKVDVVVAAVGRSIHIVGSQGTKIIADKTISEAAQSVYDLIILPVRQNKLHTLVPGRHQLSRSMCLPKQ